jgi:hypothetical protein
VEPGEQLLDLLQGVGRLEKTSLRHRCWSPEPIWPTGG